jgi:hypothetical protein
MRHAGPGAPTAGTAIPSLREPLTTQGGVPALFEECRIVRAHVSLFRGGLGECSGLVAGPCSLSRAAPRSCAAAADSGSGLGSLPA